MQFRNIERYIPGITTRILSRVQKEIETNHQIIRRTVKPTIRMTVESPQQKFGIYLATLSWK
ncbi:winged helix-turn-helix transcriptional regulator [Flavitalea sp.]